jgi:hypothetical protein
MKRVLIMAVGLLLSLPISAVAAGSAMAATGQAVSGVQPDSGGCSADYTPVGNYTIKYYSQELTDPYGGGNGTAVKFDTNIGDNTDVWEVNYIGNVGENGVDPFNASSGLNTTYQGSHVVQLENYKGTGYSAGSDSSAYAVMRPDSDGNYFVECYLGNGNNYELVNVYATNTQGLSTAMCLESFGSGDQAGYSGCGGPDQTMNIGLV